MMCQTAEPLIALHVEGDLPPDESKAVEVHLAACAACRAFAADVRESQSALKDLADADIDAAALALVRARVAEALDRRASRGLPFGLAVALAVVALLGIGLAFFKPSPGSQTSERAATPTAPLATSAPPATAPPPPSVVSTADAPTAPPTRPAVRRSAAHRPRLTIEPAAPHADEEPSPPVIKVVTGDPDVVIYWVTETNGGQS